ncbi:MAG: DUF4625 domain-containing protein, partial [Cytophagales bacterium]|nr:DUF4625 domain-containing protein [Cytophagales bacterium]
MKKTRRVLFAAIITAGLFFTSCEKEDVVPKPVIGELELGIGNSRIAYIGSDMHMEAEIIADGRIDVITVEIHKEDGSGDEIEAEYTDYTGQKNATFHKHIDIPATAVAGEYHFHLTVIDQEGNSTSVEEEITLEELADEEAPILNISSAPTNGQTYANGEEISISGKVTDNTSLAGMLVALVYESDNIADTEVTGGNKKVIVMLHTHTFDSENSHSFTASIKVGAVNDNNMTPAPIQGDNAWKSGNYY